MQKSGAWYTYGESASARAATACQAVSARHPEIAAKLEAEIRRDFHKLMSSQSQNAAKAAGRAVDVSADDFEG